MEDRDLMEDRQRRQFRKSPKARATLADDDLERQGRRRSQETTLMTDRRTADFCEGYVRGRATLWGDAYCRILRGSSTDFFDRLVRAHGTASTLPPRLARGRRPGRLL